MDIPSVELLSAQQRECLRLVWQQHSSKEIALQLGISKNTVDGYIAEAVARLGARDRRHAARLCFGEVPERQAPDQIGGYSARVADPSPSSASEARPERASFPIRLPIRREGAAHNDLSILERLFWIPLLGIAIAIGFGMLAVGLRSIGDFLTVLDTYLHGR